MSTRREFLQTAAAIAAATQLPRMAEASELKFPSQSIDSEKVENGVLHAEVGINRLKVWSPVVGVLQIDLNAHGIVDPHTPVIDPHADHTGDPSSKIDISGNTITLRTDSLRATITKSPFRVTVFNKAGEKLLDQKLGNGFRVNPGHQAENGFSFSHASNVPFYGIHNSACWTPHQLPVLRNGQGVSDDTYQVEASIEGGGGGPLAWTTAGFGILVDCDGGYFQMRPSEIGFYYGDAPLKDYGRRYFRNNSLTLYILVGAPQEILRGFSAISGHMPMFPKWAYGFINSQWGTNQELLRHYLKTYRARDIFIDNFTLDFDWKDWGASHYGEFRWNPVKYSQALYPPSNPDALINWTRELNVKIAGIMKPRIILSMVKGQLKPMTTQGASAAKLKLFAIDEKPFADYFSGLLSLDLDFYKPICRQWYWHATWKHRCMQQGIAGFWNDEADMGILGNFEFLHMQQSLYDGQRRDLPNRRIWSMNRNFYTGSQRYAYATWSGDINTGFTVMRQQTIAMTNIINLGQMRWAQDTGGFNGHPTPECYTRWFQFTAVCPTLRTHCTLGERRQPWVFGDQACETVKFAIRRRYEWFFYVYACEHECSTKGGVGIVRPLFFDYPQDSNVVGMSEQWMFGPAIMAAPVLYELGTGKDQKLSRHIYLPPGTNWIDYFRGDTYTGGQWIHYPLNPASWMDWPLFVKEGAIIPMMPPSHAIHVAKPDHAWIDIFPSDQSTEGVFYDDDGDTFDYEKGAYHRQLITARRNASGTKTEMTIGASSGHYQSTVNHFILRLHGQAATEISIHGSDAPVQVEDGLEMEHHATAWYVDEDIYGPVTLIKLPAGADGDMTVTATGHRPVSKAMERFLATEASLSGPVAPDTPLQSNNGMYALANEFGPFGDLRNTIQNNHHGYTGRGFIAGFNDVDTAATYYLSRPSAGMYKVACRFANGTPDVMRTLNVYINGIRYGTVHIPGLASWDQWQEITMYVPLVAGANTIMLRRDSDNSGKVNLDTVEVSMRPTH